LERSFVAQTIAFCRLRRAPARQPQKTMACPTVLLLPISFSTSLMMFDICDCMPVIIFVISAGCLSIIALPPGDLKKASMPSISGSV
jgi:hypothetical protein